MSARIIPLPGAAAEPVQQRRGPGRRPANIVNLFIWKRDRIKPLKEEHQATVQNELEDARRHLEIREHMYRDAQRDFALAKQRISQQKQNGGAA